MFSLDFLHMYESGLIESTRLEKSFDNREPVFFRPSRKQVRAAIKQSKDRKTKNKKNKKRRKHHVQHNGKQSNNRSQLIGIHHKRKE